MNKTTEYIDALLLSEREKAALPKTDIRAVHQALDAEHRTYSREDDSPQGSVKARLEHAWPDSLAKGQLIKDDEGRDQLQAMPKATRSSMFPDPWRTNPVGRFWDRLRGRDVTPRYVSRLTKEEQGERAKMAYRRHYTPLYFVNFDSGANRCRDLVYEDHSALSGMGAHQSYGYGGAGYLGLLYAAPALHAANRYPDFVCRAVLLGVSRILDGADGLPATAYRAR